MPRWRQSAAPLLIVVVGLLAYRNTFDVPLVFDDLERIEHNPQLRSLWPVWEPMAQTNRPLGMYTFAVNYALDGYRVWGYHAVNLAIHLAAGLLLFGIVRRTLDQSPRVRQFRPAALPLALTIGLAWLVHPLQTESVTYVIQRLESLMGLCYLATLYAVVRGQASSHPRGWNILAVLACAAGMGCKEVMITAPLLVLLFDRLLWADSWRSLFGQRRMLYLGLAATWGVLAWAMLHWKGDYTSGLVGAIEQLSPAAYLVNQAGVVLHYLRLCIWPQGQCLDTAWPASSSVLTLVPPLVCLIGLLTATLWALRHRPAAGFLGAAFFVLLAPTSSVVPIHDLAVEHRMYLPSAVALVAIVLGIYALAQRIAQHSPQWGPTLRIARPALAAGAILALAVLTARRNEIYRSPFALWADTLAAAPHNARAGCNLGEALCQAGQLERALELFERAARQEPRYALAQYNLGTTYYVLGRYDEAVEPLSAAVELNPDYAEAHNNLGLVYCQRKQTLDAVAYLFRAVELKPDNAKFQNALGTALYELNEQPDAIEHLSRSIELAADDPSAHYNLANALLADKQYARAAEHFRRVLAIAPEYEMAPYVHFGLACAIEALGRAAEAAGEYRRTLALKQDHVAAHYRLGCLLAAESQADAAGEQFRAVLALEPNHAGARRALGQAETAARGTDNVLR